MRQPNKKIKIKGKWAFCHGWYSNAVKLYDSLQSRKILQMFALRNFAISSRAKWDTVEKLQWGKSESHMCIHILSHHCGKNANWLIATHPGGVLLLLLFFFFWGARRVTHICTSANNEWQLRCNSRAGGFGREVLWM